MNIWCPFCPIRLPSASVNVTPEVRTFLCIRLQVCERGVRPCSHMAYHASSVIRSHTASIKHGCEHRVQMCLKDALWSDPSGCDQRRNLLSRCVPGGTKGLNQPLHRRGRKSVIITSINTTLYLCIWWRSNLMTNDWANVSDFFSVSEVHLTKRGMSFREISINS